MPFLFTDEALEATRSLRPATSIFICYSRKDMNSGPFLVSFIGPYTNLLVALVFLPFPPSLSWKESLLPVTLKGVSTNHVRSFYLDSDPESSILPPTLYVS